MNKITIPTEKWVELYSELSAYVEKNVFLIEIAMMKKEKE